MRASFPESIGPIGERSEGAASLAPRERRALLEEIGLIGLTLGHDLPSAPAYRLPLTPGKAASSAVSPLERLRLLETLWPPMQAALCGLARQPLQGVKAFPQPLPLTQSRGGPSVVQTLARTPAGQASWAAVVSHRGPREGKPPSVPESRPRPTADLAANRFAAALLREWTHEASALAALAAFCGEEEEAARMGQVAAAARIWHDTTFLRELPAPKPQEQASLVRSENALRCAPPYRTLFSLWRTLHRPLRFDWSGSPLLCLPSIEAWRLYEVWCFLRVAAALRACGWRLSGGDALRWEPDGLRLTLATGRASRLVFTRAASGSRNGPQGSRSPDSEAAALFLFYQPLFPSANQDARHAPRRDEARPSDGDTGFRSLSHALQPDIALQWRNRLYLLDAKFRTYAVPGAEQDDINKMHAYRDAITRRAPGGNRKPEASVAAAWCLFPGEEEPGDAILAYPRSRPEEPFGAAGVGAIRLRPGGDSGILAQLLEAWFVAPSSLSLTRRRQD
ncbi:MAG TPA: nuclease domain-containing protein [Chthonomonadaceae bacterium]|nr:nuclease domain-containing protein [Chthonomonadaceae bacterium]